MDIYESLGVLDFLCPRESMRLLNVQDNSILNKLPNMTGRVIDDGRLRIRKLVGCGSWAACFEAESTSSTGEHYAVKAIPRRDMDATQRRRVEREVQFHEKISKEHKYHKNLLQLVNTDIDEKDDRTLAASEQGLDKEVVSEAVDTEADQVQAKTAEQQQEQAKKIEEKKVEN